MRKIFFLVALVWLLFLNSLQAAPVSLDFYEQVQVTGSDILLSDIAEVQGEDAEQVAALKILKIANAAAPGGKVVLTERVFQLRFLAAAGQQPEVSWHMDNAVTVGTAAQRISGAALVDGVQNFLAQAIAKGNEQRTYKLAAIKEPAEILLPVGNVTYEYKLPYGIRYSVPNNVTVIVYVNGQLAKKLMVRMQAHVYESVVVANKVLNTNQTVTPADLRIENYDVSSLPASYYKEINAVAGMVAKRMIKEGMPLVESMLDSPVVMERAAMIRIVSKVGNVQVYAEGQAMQPGKVGKWVRVKNVKTGKVVMGKVIDAVTVEVTAS